MPCRSRCRQRRYPGHREVGRNRRAHVFGTADQDLDVRVPGPQFRSCEGAGVRGFWSAGLCLHPGLRGRFAPPLGALSSRATHRRRGSTALEENDLGGLRFQPRLGSWRARRRGITLPMIRNPCRSGSSAGGSWEKSDTPVGEGRSSLPTLSIPTLSGLGVPAS